jgi:hypothetical protein
MKIFVGWAYEAKWVDEYVIPLIETYGVEVLTGKELQGKEITQGVKDYIEEADAALFITTCRGDKDTDGHYATSPWVLSEIEYANAKNKRVIIEVREKGVDYAMPIHGERQYIPLDPADPMKCLVEIGKTIGRGRGLSLKLKLSPVGPADDKQDFNSSLRRRLNNKSGYTCRYRIRQKGKISHNVESIEIVREGEDQFFLYTDELPSDFFNSPDAFMEVEISMGDIQWLSYGIRFNALEVPLERSDSQQGRYEK